MEMDLVVEMAEAKVCHNGVVESQKADLKVQFAQKMLQHVVKRMKVVQKMKVL